VAIITIDGTQHELDPAGRNLLDVCLSLGYDVPYFCWHPAMHSVGACRQCAVKQFADENDTRGRIVMACMTAVTDGMRVATQDPEAVAFRRSVAEWLMVNHPHDCPVCDEGGECHLQDMTIMGGHVTRRHRFPKRTYRNQDLGPFIAHEMNRCIHCYRCVRFYRNYVGGRDFGAFGWHDHVYFGRFADGTLESEFAGNLVEVCPTGVFTDKTLKRHYTRPWDLQTAPSVCVHCGLGCNTLPGERYGMLRRIRNRYNDAVNGYFLCDRGRFGYEFVNGEKRIRAPRLRHPASDRFDDITVERAQEVVAEIAREHQLIGIGSPRASVEANYALRTQVGEENFYCGLSARNLEIMQEMFRVLQEGPVASASLADVSRCDAAFVLGEDVNNTAPMLALALRQTVIQRPLKLAKELSLHAYEDSALREAIQREKGPLYVAFPAATPLEDVTTRRYAAAPPEIARLGFAVAHALDPEAPEPQFVEAETAALAAEIATALKEADNPLIVAGFSVGRMEVIHAAANVAYALHKLNPEVRLFFTVPHCNSLGLALLGGGSLEEAHERLKQDPSLATILIENDLHRELSTTEADLLLRAAEHLVILDHVDTASTPYADLVLPAATFAESSGTLVNNEGRAQRYFQVFQPEGAIQESWRWIAEMIRDRTGEAPWERLDELILQIAELPGFAGITEAAPPADYRLHGQKIPRQAFRRSGRTAEHADKTVREPAPPVDADAPLSFSMEGSGSQPPASLVTSFRAPGWNSAQGVNRFQERIAGPLREGPCGCRLLEPAATLPPYYFPEVETFVCKEACVLIMPLYHVFGSEELSSQGPAIAALTPQPHVKVAPADLERLGVEDGQMVEVAAQELKVRVPLRRAPELPPGIAALTVALPGMPGLALPDWGTIKPAAQGDETP
jgi:NADH-quinone oxidoreductase subunit G